ncbi:hypothetical protein ACFE04_021227 [Oxalis oulophora]
MKFNRRKADPVPLFTPNHPYFFKFIFTSTIREGKLGIPREFTRKYGSNLSNRVTLKVLPNAEWKIGLERSKKAIWLQNGWTNFVDYYSLAHGNLLVFRYDKDSTFSVTILDVRNSSEICYPYVESESETDDSVSVEILDNYSKRSHRSQSQLSNPRPRKIVRTDSGTKLQKDENGGSFILRRIQSKIVMMKQLIYHEKAFCLEMAKDFVSDYPHFKVVMQPSFVRTKGRMSLPVDFAREYLNKKDVVILLNSDLRKWYMSSAFHSTPRLENGWLKFALDNNLEVGDVCAFELIKKTDNQMVFRVSIFKLSEKFKCFHSPGESGSSKTKRKNVQCAEGRTRAPRELADKFTSEYPFFRITFCSSHQYGVTAPWKFTEKLTKQTTENETTLVHLQVGEKSWPVKFHSYPEHQYGKFDYSISTFAWKNSLEIGDDCVFELINKKDAIVKRISLAKKFVIIFCVFDAFRRRTCMTILKTVWLNAG